MQNLIVVPGGRGGPWWASLLSLSQVAQARAFCNRQSHPKLELSKETDCKLQTANAYVAWACVGLYGVRSMADWYWQSNGPADTDMYRTLQVHVGDFRTSCTGKHTQSSARELHFFPTDESAV